MWSKPAATAKLGAARPRRPSMAAASGATSSRIVKRIGFYATARRAGTARQDQTRCGTRPRRGSQKARPGHNVDVPTFREGTEAAAATCPVSLPGHKKRRKRTHYILIRLAGPAVTPRDLFIRVRNCGVTRRGTAGAGVALGVCSGLEQQRRLAGPPPDRVEIPTQGRERVGERARPRSTSRFSVIPGRLFPCVRKPPR